MKTIPIHLEDEQYNKLIKAKGKMTWVEFIMTLTEGK